MNTAQISLQPKQRPGFRLRACLRCGGDAFPDLADGGWRCLQCARPVTEDGREYIPQLLLADDDEPGFRSRAA